MADPPPPPALPNHIMDEILSRTSLETLGRCRLVSKELKQTTYSSKFSGLFLQRTKTLSVFLFQSKYCLFMDNAKVGLEQMEKIMFFPFLPLPDKVNIIAATKSGILLCKTEISQTSSTQYYVCKLTTKQWQRIPNPDPNYVNEVSIGMVVLRSRPNLRYKIVRFLLTKSNGVLYRSLSCEIFDSDTWSWKQLNGIEKLPCSANDGFNKLMVSACGKFYWILGSEDEDEDEYRIFEFDPEKESWKFLSLPEELGMMEVCKRMALVEYEGWLGLVCILVEKECMELWVKELKLSGKNIWSKKQKVCIKNIMRKNPNVYPLALWNNDVAILMDGYLRLIIFYFEDGHFFYRIYKDLLVSRDFLLLQSDWEPVNLPEPENLPYTMLRRVLNKFCLYFVEK